MMGTEAEERWKNELIGKSENGISVLKNLNYTETITPSLTLTLTLTLTLASPNPDTKP